MLLDQSPRGSLRPGGPALLVSELTSPPSVGFERTHWLQFFTLYVLLFSLMTVLSWCDRGPDRTCQRSAGPDNKDGGHYG